MEKYDVVAVGGGIAGSVAARYAAEGGLKTLLIEKKKVPRHKACSGIQFGYFEKLLGAKIPRDKLCTNELKRVRLTFPNGKSMATRFKMFSFWRDTFDHWLNTLAADAGAEFRDQTTLKSFEEKDGQFFLRLSKEDGSETPVQSKYVIAADGLNSDIRKIFRPQDNTPKNASWAINWYYKGDTGSVDPNTLYMYYNVDFCTLMFAWVYFKDDLLCIGTGTDREPQDYIKRFTDHVRQQFNVKADVVKRESFTQYVTGGMWLGQGNILMAGDAAGLLDLTRGVCMDDAAHSARHAVDAILQAEEAGAPAIAFYEKGMERTKRRLEKNASRSVSNFKTNGELQGHMKKWLIRAGPKMLLSGPINKLRSWKKTIFLPP